MPESNALTYLNPDNSANSGQEGVGKVLGKFLSPEKVAGTGLRLTWL